MVKYEFRLDLSGVDLKSLYTDHDFRREAERLLPGALEELGRAFGEAAWKRQAVTNLDSNKVRRDFVVKAGRTYRQFAPPGERCALEELLIQKLRDAKDQTSARIKSENDATIPIG